MSILIWLILLLVGCASDSEPVENDRSKDITPLEDAQADTAPFIVGTSHRLILEITALTPGEKESSIELTVAFKQRTDVIKDENGGEIESESEDEGESGSEDDSSTDDEGGNGNEDGSDNEDGEESGNEDEDITDDPNAIFVGETDVSLFWVCGKDEHRGYSEVKMRGSDIKVKTIVSGLPPLPQVGASIPCVITAEFEAKDHAGEKVLASGSNEFYIEADILYPALQMEVVAREIDEDGRSVVNLKVAIIRNGEPIKQGDVAFDEEVNADLEWVCNNEDKSDKKTRIKIGAGKGEETGSVSLPARPELGGPGFACVIIATTKISGYVIPIVTQKKVWITGRDLQVAVTKAVTDSALGYVVTADNKELREKITLTISSTAGESGCDEVKLKQGEKEPTKTISDLNSLSDGTVLLEGSGTGCVLTATVASAGNPERKGTRAFNVSEVQN